MQPADRSVNHICGTNSRLLAGCAVAAGTAVLYSPRLALIPIALMFGWMQIGGL